MNERPARSIPSCPWGVSSQPWGRRGRKLPPLPLQFHLIQLKTNVVSKKLTPLPVLFPGSVSQLNAQLTQTQTARNNFRPLIVKR